MSEWFCELSPLILYWYHHFMCQWRRAQTMGALSTWWEGTSCGAGSAKQEFVINFWFLVYVTVQNDSSISFLCDSSILDCNVFQVARYFLGKSMRVLVRPNWYASLFQYSGVSCGREATKRENRRNWNHGIRAKLFRQMMFGHKNSMLHLSDGDVPFCRACLIAPNGFTATTALKQLGISIL